jgi:hypothetical protein
MAEELLEISDGEDGQADTHRDRLRVETRKWLLSKALPKIYGDKTTHEHAGKNGGPIQIKWMESRQEDGPVTIEHDVED